MGFVHLGLYLGTFSGSPTRTTREFHEPARHRQWMTPTVTVNTKAKLPECASTNRHQTMLEKKRAAFTRALSKPNWAWLPHYVPLLRWIADYKVGERCHESERGLGPGGAIEVDCGRGAIDTPLTAVVLCLRHLLGRQRAYLVPDIIAGLTVGIMAIPQAMSYAVTSGVAAQVRRYACTH